jgi:hypothetical protein
MKDEPGKFESLMQGLGMDLLLLLKVIAILFAAWFVERLIYFALRRGYAKAKAQGREEMTRYRFFRNGVRTMMVILALIAIIYTIPSLRSLALTLFAGAGIIAVGHRLCGAESVQRHHQRCVHRGLQALPCR